VNLHLDCIPCYLRQALEAIRMVTDDNRLQEKILRKCLIAASKFDTNAIGIFTHNRIHKIIKKYAPNVDPYREIKQRFNTICLNMSDEIQHIVAQSSNPFETSLRIALAGNIIDFGPERDGTAPDDFLEAKQFWGRFSNRLPFSWGISGENCTLEEH